jgi:tetratricopeptide (TPR) repeat protein
MGLDLGMTEKQIDDMRPYRTQDGRTFYLNNQVVDAVIENNARKVPINFSVTVAAEGRKFQGKPIDPYLTITGLSWRLREDGNGMRAAVDEALGFFHDTTRFQMRGVFDSTIYKDDNQLRLLRNYSNAMIMIADSLRKAKRLDEGIRLLEYGYQILPLDNELVNYLAGMYTEVGREDGLRSLMEKSSGGDPKWLAVMLGRQLRSAGKFQEAETTLNQVFLANPTYRAAYEELCMLYNEQRNYRSLRTTFEIWLKANPKDSEAAEMLMRLDEFLTAQGKPDSAK